MVLFFVAHHRPYRYWAACTDLPGELVQYIADPDRNTKLTYRAFARQADLEPLRAADHPAMYRISAPDNWAISFWRSELPSGQKIYFFDWSRIEHVFVDREVDLDREMRLLRAPNPVERRAAHLVSRYPRTVVADALSAWAEAVGAHQFKNMVYGLQWNSLREPTGDARPIEIAETVKFLGTIVQRHPHLRTTPEEKHLPWVARELNRQHKAALKQIHDFGRLTVRQGKTIQTKTPPGARPQRTAEGEYMVTVGEKIADVQDVGEAVLLLRQLLGAREQGGRPYQPRVGDSVRIGRDLGAIIREQYVYPMDDIVRSFGGVAAWARSTGTDLGSLQFEDARCRAVEWLEVQRITAMAKPPGIVRYQWPDDWTVRELTTQEDLDFEGGLMGHCTDKREYYRVEDLGFNMRLFSLRDPNNLPHATMEWSIHAAQNYPRKVLVEALRQGLPGAEGEDLMVGHAEQLRGKGNVAPLNEYTARMAEFRDVALPIPAPDIIDLTGKECDRFDGDNFQGYFSVEDSEGLHEFEVWSNLPYLSDETLESDVEDWLSEHRELGDYDPIVHTYHWEGPSQEYEWWFARQPKMHLNHSEDELVTALIEAERHGPGMSPLAAIRSRTGRLV